MGPTNTTTPDNVTAANEEALDFFTDDDLAPQLPETEIETFSVAGGKKRKIAVKRLKGDELIKAISDTSNAAALKDRLALKLKRCVLNQAGSPHFTDISIINYISKCEGETLLEMLAAVHRVNPLLKNG